MHGLFLRRGQLMAKRKKASTRASKAAGGVPATSSPVLTWQHFWAFVGYFAAVASVIAIAFGIGSHWGAKREARREFKTFTEYLQALKEGVRIVTFSSTPGSIHAGETVTLSLGIRNESPYDCELWVGASAITPSGPEIHNVQEDRRVQLPSAGLTKVRRELTIPPKAKVGKYTLRVNLWFGKVGDPDQSERICNATLGEYIIVQAALSSQ